ncbi:MAG: hypothetical protein ACR2QF_12290 [Geminicoccaceae bacterium]
MFISDQLISSQPSVPGDYLVFAQADALNDVRGSSHQQVLESILSRDNIAGAMAFVDALAKANELEPATLRSMKDRIWRIKTDRVLEYSAKIREAIAKSDFAAVGEYSERMRRLTAPEPSSTVTSTVHIGTLRSGTISDLAPSSLDESQSLAVEAAGASNLPSIDYDAGMVEQMRRASEDGRFFPPAADTAFDLAAARLSMVPHDPKAQHYLAEAIKKQQAQVSANLQDGRLEAALDVVNQLRNSLGDSDAKVAWPSNYRSQMLGWVDEIQHDIVASLVVAAEEAIEQRWLTVAPEGETSAAGYVDILAAHLGQDHDDVARLADKIIARYRDLVGELLAKQQYDQALRLHSRMEVISVRFGVSIDQVAAQRRDIEAERAMQQQHDQLLLLAAQWRDKGQLIKPAGANALEFAGKAVGLAVDLAAANKVFNDLVIEQRRRVDRLIATGRLQEAGRELKQLAAAIEQVDTKQAEKAADYYAAAEQVLRQAVPGNSRRQQRTRDENENGPVAPPEISRNSPSTFTFINPF